MTKAQDYDARSTSLLELAVAMDAAAPGRASRRTESTGSSRLKKPRTSAFFRDAPRFARHNFSPNSNVHHRIFPFLLRVSCGPIAIGP